MKPLPLCLAALMLALLAGCGWHLRGSLMPPLDIDNIRIVSAEQHTQLLRELEEALLDQDIQVVEQDADYTLALAEEELRRRTVGVGADSLAAAFELRLSINYQLLDANGALISQQEQASISRSYDATDTTGLEREQDLLLGEMRRDLARQILRRTYFILQENTP
ncbi:LPS assembly lipoprotein LptE [Gilvimarinus sp. DA14]|uniref:LPS-assembly lipoprotein LptE n=1 Tax=Gilvimarinus sp. DA14 TaxID=2956798 RepID=UPI0020B639D8|nr:LPS assembly lipoprotein LptE [Gilvimarinus sp. DA14]UTF59980.1 LPS assembly lipoprotein LptE [Gilvimarinus sp. DA14]